ILMPQVWPGVGACAVFAFSLSLGNYIYAATFISASSARNISAGVPTELIRGDVFYWPQLMAATLVVAIPLAIAYGLFFNYVAGEDDPHAGAVARCSPNWALAAPCMARAISGMTAISISGCNCRRTWASCGASAAAAACTPAWVAPIR